MSYRSILTSYSTQLYYTMKNRHVYATESGRMVIHNSQLEVTIINILYFFDPHINPKE